MDNANQNEFQFGVEIDPYHDDCDIIPCNTCKEAGIKPVMRASPARFEGENYKLYLQEYFPEDLGLDLESKSPQSESAFGSASPPVSDWENEIGTIEPYKEPVPLKEVVVHESELPDLFELFGLGSEEINDETSEKEFIDYVRKENFLGDAAFEAFQQHRKDYAIPFYRRQKLLTFGTIEGYGPKIMDQNILDAVIFKETNDIFALCGIKEFDDLQDIKLEDGESISPNEFGAERLQYLVESQLLDKSENDRAERIKAYKALAKTSDTVRKDDPGEIFPVAEGASSSSDDLLNSTIPGSGYSGYQRVSPFKPPEMEVLKLFSTIRGEEFGLFVYPNRSVKIVKYLDESQIGAEKVP
jgi:hypothetical protein